MLTISISDLAFKRRTRFLNRRRVVYRMLELLDQYPDMHGHAIGNIRAAARRYLQPAAVRYVGEHSDLFSNDAAFLTARYMLVTEGLCGRRTLTKRQPVYTDAQAAAFNQCLRMIRCGKLSGMTGRPMFASGQANFQSSVEMMVYEPEMFALHRKKAERMASRTSSDEAVMRALRATRAKIAAAEALQRHLLRTVWLRAALPHDEYAAVKDLPMTLLLPMYGHFVPANPREFAQLVPEGSAVPYPDFLTNG